MILKTVLASVCTLLAIDAFAVEPDCMPQTAIDVAKIDRQVVFVGEVHGTKEIPRFTLGLVCSLLGAGKPVILAIEHAGDEQESLNRYVVSSGSASDRKALLNGINWRVYSDGRGSGAMFELIDGVRRLRERGQRVGIVALDRNESIDVPLRDDEKVHVPPDANAILNRLGNEAMANSVVYAATLNPHYVVVVLSGYPHTSTKLAVSNTAMFGTYKPMGQIVAEQMPTYTIGIQANGGEHAFGTKTIAVDPGPLYESGIAVDATMGFDRLTPSAPARDTVR